MGQSTTVAGAVPLMARPRPETTAERTDFTSPRIMGCLAAALLVLILVVAAIQYSRSAGLIAAFWPAVGVAVAGWLKGPRTREFDLAYGMLLVVAYGVGNILVGNTIAQTLVFTFGNMLEVGLAVSLIRRFTREADLTTLGGLVRFLIAAPVVAPLVSGALVAAIASGMGWGQFTSGFTTWWFGHGLGIATIAPVVLSFDAAARARLANPFRLAEAVALLAVAFAVSCIVFFQHSLPIGFLVTPVLLIAAVRMRTLGASAAILIVTACAVVGAVSNAGPTAIMHGADLESKIRLIQLYCIFGCLPALPVAAILDERDALAAAAKAGQSRAEAASAGKSRLLANVSHEIKSPVAGIIGIGELWAGGKLGPVTSTQGEMADMLVRTARQVEALAYDLLDVANAEAGSVAVKLQPVDLESLAEDVRRSMQMKPEGQALRWSIEGRGQKVTAMADSVRLVQIVTNLATNAVKYGASGGQVILRVARPSEGRVRFEVEDKGPGIPEAKQAELFEPFNRLGMEKSTVEGHGIGLALAKRLAELQGGTMGFVSAPGEGARFWVELPAANAA